MFSISIIIFQDINELISVNEQSKPPPKPSRPTAPSRPSPATRPAPPRPSPARPAPAKPAPPKKPQTQPGETPNIAPTKSDEVCLIFLNFLTKVSRYQAPRFLYNLQFFIFSVFRRTMLEIRLISNT